MQNGYDIWLPILKSIGWIDGDKITKGDGNPITLNVREGKSCYIYSTNKNKSESEGGKTKYEANFDESAIYQTITSYDTLRKLTYVNRHIFRWDAITDLSYLADD